ncbi:UDP-N-acetyl-D-galactosamine dehydrogenase [Pseudarcicella hirudinis]|uniref:UDP-N-acetyl-D-galactosamine dehydrogenase n=1 Tax=Pseudarcicella hirudinis TaxID=1079859 RepID=A0A1I5VSI7_9BACT|nr:UDP-N-acetyl-D-galactosamine dehydrogenase [Pseudarcicella hirudinis]
MELSDVKIAIVGLGYVGLPLSVEFGKKYPVTGFDINQNRVLQLRKGLDITHEIDEESVRKAVSLTFADKIEDIRDCNIYIITVPTPIDNNKQPDLKPLLHATNLVAGLLKKGDIVIYESTVYPGCTEEDCVPELEKLSGLVFNKDFFCGYSPERINPGDKINTVTKIKKVTSGSTPEVAVFIDRLYSSIIEAGTFRAPSIKVAEASKIIENAQRDVNISFVNELAMIFDRMGIDTNEVLTAAGTKWNFLNFKPGLVGGNCISVDPYYLLHKSKSLGYTPDIISSCRNVNDNMPVFVANKFVKLLIRKGVPVNNAKVLLLGFSFKENVSDFRNTGVLNVYRELTDFGLNVSVYDPLINGEEVFLEYGIKLIETPEEDYAGIMLSVAHEAFRNFGIEEYRNRGTLIFDVKSFWDKELVDERL